MIARKYIVLDPPEKVTRDENGKVVEKYAKEAEVRNNKQLEQEKEFLRSLYL